MTRDRMLRHLYSAAAAASAWQLQASVAASTERGYLPPGCRLLIDAQAAWVADQRMRELLGEVEGILTTEVRR